MGCGASLSSLRSESRFQAVFSFAENRPGLPTKTSAPHPAEPEPPSARAERRALRSAELFLFLVFSLRGRNEFRGRVAALGTNAKKPRDGTRGFSKNPADPQIMPSMSFSNFTMSAEKARMPWAVFSVAIASSLSMNRKSLSLSEIFS